jgi:hypothetical protein
MAQKIVATLVSDLDGSDADETVYFALDGRDYEIDLSAGQAEALRASVRKFVAHARKAPAGAQHPRRRRQHQASPKATEIREWARCEGKKVNEFGRIPASLVAEYAAAHAGGLLAPVLGQ